MKSKRAKKLKNQLDTILATEINSAFQRNPSFSFSENNRGNVNMVSSIMEKSDFQDRKKKKIVEVFLKLQKKKKVIRT
jgi:16S rRNA C967 or C1407 C5-methylase (RsmB/RsmF family)